MKLRRSLQVAAAALMLAASAVPSQAAVGWGGCGEKVVVQAGDTLSSIAQQCGTTAWAILEANPGIGWNIYAGQVLKMPGGHSQWPNPYPTPAIGGTYTVKWGDTLGKIAARYNVSLRDLLAVNRQIWNPDLIYPWQVINLPAYASKPPVYPTQKPPAYPTQKPPCYYSCYPEPGAKPTATPLPYAPAIDYALYRSVTVTYKYGLLVRYGPGRDYKEIASPLVSAVKGTQWWYRLDSVTTDASGFVWAEVYLRFMVDGRTTGWIMVADRLGNHFTEPEINN
jgi:LysM repeat protein